MKRGSSAGGLKVKALAQKARDVGLSPAQHYTFHLYNSLLREKLFIKHYCFGIRSYYEVEEQSNDFAQIHQGKGWHKRRIIQKALPHRGWNPHIIWVPKNS